MALSLSRSRLPLYVLPLVPAVALLVARAALVLRPRATVMRRAWGLAVTGALLCVVLKGVGAAVPSEKNMAQLRAAIGEDTGAGVVAVDLDELYGLDFYLGGRLERIRSRDLAKLKARIDANPGDELVIIVRRNRVTGLDKLCDDPALRCRIDTTSSPDYSIWRIVHTP
ncbi:MAG TPA: hypothetical protein VFX92_06600 [Candidatus Krumholzibacteria bacterium]|nr:hypothetical protein [Candidatus Krumholzibacteria bacterium]